MKNKRAVLYGFLLPKEIINFVPSKIFDEKKELLGEEEILFSYDEHYELFGVLADYAETDLYPIQNDDLTTFVSSYNDGENEKLKKYFDGCVPVIINYWVTYIKNFIEEKKLLGMEEKDIKLPEHLELPETLDFSFYFGNI